MKSKLPDNATLIQHIRDGLVANQIGALYGLSRTHINTYLRRNDIYRPWATGRQRGPSKRTPDVRRIDRTQFLPAQRRYQGPVDDARRVVLNGISVPRIVSIHGEFRG